MAQKVLPLFSISKRVKLIFLFGQSEWAYNSMKTERNEWEKERREKTNKWIYSQGLFDIQCTILLIKIFLISLLTFHFSFLSGVVNSFFFFLLFLRITKIQWRDYMRMMEIEIKRLVTNHIDTNETRKKEEKIT